MRINNIFLLLKFDRSGKHSKHTNLLIGSNGYNVNCYTEEYIFKSEMTEHSNTFCCRIY